LTNLALFILTVWSVGFGEKKNGAGEKNAGCGLMSNYKTDWPGCGLVSRPLTGLPGVSTSFKKFSSMHYYFQRHKKPCIR